MKLIRQLKGNLTMLILRILQRDGKLYGLEILKAIESTSTGKLKLSVGSFYTVLGKLETTRAITGSPEASPKGGPPVT
jgi:PadR family transcriptional regulator, regulatory protein PadR